MIGDGSVVRGLSPAVVPRRGGQVAMAEPVPRGEELAVGDQDDRDRVAEPVQGSVGHSGERSEPLKPGRQPARLHERRPRGRRCEQPIVIASSRLPPLNVRAPHVQPELVVDDGVGEVGAQRGQVGGQPARNLQARLVCGSRLGQQWSITDTAHPVQGRGSAVHTA